MTSLPFASLTRTALAALALATATATTATTAARAEDVRMFNRVPTVDELNAAMTGGGGGTAAPRIGKTRAIEIYGDTAPPAGTAGQGSTTQPPRKNNGATGTASSAGGGRPHTTELGAARPQAPADAVGFPINFAYNSADIMPESRPYVDVMGQLLQKKPQMAVTIEGHTDASGSDSYNLELSARRADAVRNYLMANYGVESKRLSAVGKGKTNPLVPSDPFNAMNRRVQFRPASGG